MKSSTPVRSILKAAVAVALTALVWVQPARAQFGMAGGGDMTQFMAPVTKKAVESFAVMVGMDKDQKESALTLQEGYRSSFKQLQADMQKKMKELQDKFQDTQDFTIWGKEAPKIGKDFTERMEKLDKGFLEDVKSLLNEKQLEKWPRVERARRREALLRFGFMSGQNVDLVRMLQSVGAKIDGTPELADQVERYELDLDKQLVAFEKWGKEQQAKQVEGDMMANFDMTKIQAMLKEMADKARGMRDTNRQYAKSIGALLPADQAGKLDMEVKKKSFPRVYKESYASKALSESAKFNDLDGTQSADISQLKAAYERELDAANKRWAAAIEDREEKNNGTIGAMMSGMMGGGKDDKSDIGEARKARKELDERTKDKLLAILKEDQKKRLPEDKVDTKENQFEMFNFDPPEHDED